MNAPMLDPVLAAPLPVDEFHQQIGQLTRQVHDALERLGLLPGLQQAATGLPDARSRLGYIARKCGDAADRVLNAVDRAKAEQEAIADAARVMSAAAAASLPIDRMVVRAQACAIDAARQRTDDCLTDIMLAQDYHDLTGQVVGKVIDLAIALEESLVRLLVQSAPPAERELAGLQGPVHAPEARTDIVADQSEVDDLLANLGF